MSSSRSSVQQESGARADSCPPKRSGAADLQILGTVTTHFAQNAERQPKPHIVSVVESVESGPQLAKKEGWLLRAATRVPGQAGI